jgi:hypothetical protein
VALLTVYAEPAIQRSAPPVFDRVAEPLGRRRLTNDAGVDGLAALEQRRHDRRGTVDRIAFFI